MSETSDPIRAGRAWSPGSGDGDQAPAGAPARRAVRRLWPLPFLPLTCAMLALVCGTTAFLQVRPVDLPDAVAWASTNVHNLGSHPVAAMLASIFVVTGPPWMELTLLAIGSSITEARLGVRRTIAIGLGGHVIATLLTEYGAALFGALHLAAASSPDRPDVGVSYVVYTLIGAAAVLLPRRIGPTVLLAATAAVVVPWVVDPEMTTTGHVLSLACGVAATSLLSRRSSRIAAEPAGC